MRRLFYLFLEILFYFSYEIRFCSLKPISCDQKQNMNLTFKNDHHVMFLMKSFFPGFRLFFQSLKIMQ